MSTADPEFTNLLVNEADSQNLYSMECEFPFQLESSSQEVFTSWCSPASEFPAIANDLTASNNNAVSMMHRHNKTSSYEVTAEQRICADLSDYSFYLTAGRIRLQHRGTERHDKRKSQNRQAQRLYRARKEQLRVDLEAEVERWQQKYEALEKSHASQKEEIDRLRMVLNELTKTISHTGDSGRQPDEDEDEEAQDYNEDKEDDELDGEEEYFYTYDLDLYPDLQS